MKILLLLLLVPIATAMGQGEKEPPPPVNRAPPEDQLPIDDNIWVLLVFGVVLGIYFYYHMKSHRKIEAKDLEL
ncbi:hypothetical protein [Aureitalea marina]|uniref:hypothetical protein n=1 Tax=Aureitalea marina TaxID=930804 RepID=UPI0011B03ED2|nr:hypothetical protein [Aureitalea marina]